MPDNVPAWLGQAFENPREGHGRLAVARVAGEGMIGKGGFTMHSAAFADRMALDPSFTADEEDAVAPPLEWSEPPKDTQELALVVENPDAPGDEPSCHWLVWGLAPQKGQILEGEIPQRVGKNSQGNSEWLLPDPPTGEEPHDYVFQLFALDLPLTLMPGATRDQLIKEMENHVIGVALLTGTYKRAKGGPYDLDEDDEA